jgi:hypothetical protein
MNEDNPLAVSRRRLLGGLLAATAAPLFLTQAWAQPSTRRSVPRMPLNLHLTGEINLHLSGETSAPVPRCQHASGALPDGRILVVGGWRHSGLSSYVPPLANAQIYDPRANTWTEAASLKMGRAQHAAVTLPDGRVLVTGGMNHAPMASTEIYDPASDTWTGAASLPQALYDHSVAVSGELVVVTGGFNQGPQACLHLYDAGADVWHTVR